MFPCEAWSPCGLRESVRHRDFHTKATATHQFKHFAVLFQKDSHSMLFVLCKCNLFNLSAPKPKALVQVLLTMNQFPTLQSFGLIIPMMYVGSRTNRWNVHSQINTNLLSICYMSFWYVVAQGAKRNTSQSWEALPPHCVPGAEASAALSIQAKITEPDFFLDTVHFPLQPVPALRHSSCVYSIMLKNSSGRKLHW